MLKTRKFFFITKKRKRFCTHAKAVENAYCVLPPLGDVTLTTGASEGKSEAAIV